MSYQEEDTVGYWDEHGAYQYYEQDTSQQWYGDGGSAPSSPMHAGNVSVANNIDNTSTSMNEWELAYDDDNNPYYFNHSTSEWQYEVPVDYVDPYGAGEYHSPGHEELGYWDENGEYVYYEATETPDEQHHDHDPLNETTGTTGTEEEGPSNFTDSQGWQAVDDGYGNVYFYNNLTDEQQWEEPTSYTQESNVQPWSTEVAATFEGTKAEHAAALRIQTTSRGRKAKQLVAGKRQRHNDLKNMHASAVVDGNLGKNQTGHGCNQTARNASSKKSNATIEGYARASTFAKACTRLCGCTAYLVW